MPAEVRNDVYRRVLDIPRGRDDLQGAPRPSFGPAGGLHDVYRPAFGIPRGLNDVRGGLNDVYRRVSGIPED